MLDIKYELTTSPKQKPAADDPLVFGTIFTDPMRQEQDGMTQELCHISQLYWNHPQWYFIMDRRCLKD